MRCVDLGLLALALAGCVGDNPRFAGPGFDDPVQGDRLHPVWEELPPASLWSLSTCDGEDGDDDASLRLGVGNCGGIDVVALAAVDAADKQLVSRAIPVVGKVTLAFVTRPAFPSCGDRAWAGGRVVVRGDDFAGPIELDAAELPLADDGASVLGGRGEWIEVEHSFVVEQLQDIVVSFGPVIADGRCIDPRMGDPCRLAAGAELDCGPVAACCSAALAASRDVSWQLDDIRLSVEP